MADPSEFEREVLELLKAIDGRLKSVERMVAALPDPDERERQDAAAYRIARGHSQKPE